MYNLFLYNNYFPSEFKLANITSIHKTGYPNNPSNYQSIYILPCLSKIFEFIIYKQLYNHVQEHHILSKNQFGFRPKYSTTHTIIRYIDYILHNANSSLSTISLYTY